MNTYHIAVSRLCNFSSHFVLDRPTGHLSTERGAPLHTRTQVRPGCGTFNIVGALEYV